MLLWMACEDYALEVIMCTIPVPLKIWYSWAVRLVKVPALSSKTQLKSFVQVWLCFVDFCFGLFRDIWNPRRYSSVEGPLRHWDLYHGQRGAEDQTGAWYQVLWTCVQWWVPKISHLNYVVSSYSVFLPCSSCKKEANTLSASVHCCVFSVFTRVCRAFLGSGVLILPSAHSSPSST